MRSAAEGAPRVVPVLPLPRVHGNAVAVWGGAGGGEVRSLPAGRGSGSAPAAAPPPGRCAPTESGTRPRRSPLRVSGAAGR